MGVIEELRRPLVYCVMVFVGLFASIIAVFMSLVRFGPLVLFKGRKQYKEMPSCMNDPQLGTHGDLTTEFGNIHYVASGPEDKPLMLFLHGFPENWYSWRYQILEFQKDYRVVAIDTRGAGNSQKSSSRSDFSMDKLTVDIKDVLEALEYSSCVLVGHDWGGVLAWHVAGTYPSLVDKLIVINAPEMAQMQYHAYNIVKQTVKSWYMFAHEWPWLPEFIMSMNQFAAVSRSLYGGPENKYMTEEDLEAVRYGLSRPGSLTSGINYYRGNMSLLSKREERKSVLCPTILIWATGDKYLDVALTTGHEKYVQDMTVALIEGGNHFIHQYNPDEVNRAMRQFLKREQEG